MLVVKTYVDKSKIHGFGLFAGEDIKKGTVIWKFNPVIDRKFNKKEFASLCREIDNNALKHLLNTCYKKNDEYYYLTDDARFINHSEKYFNIKLIDTITEIAVKDIKKDEEILENYNLCYDKDDYFFYEDKLENIIDYFKFIDIG